MKARLLAAALFLLGLLLISQQPRAQLGMTGVGGGFGPSGGAFTPASLTGLKLWVKGDANTFSDTGCSSAATNGNPVKCWGDNSGLGNNLVSGSAAVANLATNNLNSMATVNFVTTASQPLEAAVTLSPATTISCFGLFEDTVGIPNNDRFISVQGSGQSNDYGNANSFNLDQSASTTLTLQQNFGSVASGTNALSTWYQYGFVFNGTTATLYIGGTSAGSSSNTSTMTSPPTIAVGGAAVGGGNPLTGYSAEFFCGNADWTSNVTQIHTYLHTRWGIN